MATGARTGRWAGTWRQPIELAYAAVMLSLLTIGPVHAYWRGRLAEGPTSLDSAMTATFVLVELPALFLLGRRLSSTRRPPAVLAVLGGLVAWLLIGTAWATRPATTLVAVTGLLLTCAAGVYLAVSFSWRTIVAVLFVAMQPGLVVSRIAIEREWPGFLDETGNVAGIFGNRNSLGPPAVFAVAAGAILIAHLGLRAWRTRSFGAVPLLVAIAGTMAFDLDLQIRSESATSWMMLVVLLGVTCLAGATTATRWFARSPRAATTIGALTVAGAAAGFLAALTYDTVASLPGKFADFDNRSDYWRASVDGFADRPFVGWGWQSAWFTPEFREHLPAYLSDQLYSHSAFLDLVLGGGVVAGVLTILLFASGARSAAMVLVPGAPSSTVPLALIAAIGLACTQESFFVGHHFLTVLLVAGLCASVATQREPDARRNSASAAAESSDVGHPVGA